MAQGFGAQKPKNSLPNPKAIRWFAELQRLVPYQENFALLPVGWGKDSKGPMLAEWQKHHGFTIPELEATAGIRSVGARTGIRTGPLLCYDVDGATALELACSRGLEPWAITTWQVHRDNDPFRLKVLFRPTPDQIAQLPGGAEFQGKTITRPAVKDANGVVIEKGEALDA